MSRTTSSNGSRRTSTLGRRERADGGDASAGATVHAPASAPARSGGQALGCRLLDVVLALVLLVATAPLMAVIALAIRIETPGSPLFRQRRLGQDLRPFTINKFRTMYAGIDHDVHRAFVYELIRGVAQPQADREAPVFKLTTDPRVTRVGSILRRTSIDELPQLFNVLLGHMSLVGPRPPL